MSHTRVHFLRASADFLRTVPRARPLPTGPQPTTMAADAASAEAVAAFIARHGGDGDDALLEFVRAAAADVDVDDSDALDDALDTLGGLLPGLASLDAHNARERVAALAAALAPPASPTPAPPQRTASSRAARRSRTGRARPAARHLSRACIFENSK